MKFIQKGIESLLSKKEEYKWILAGKCMIAGIVAGGLAVFYRLAIEYGAEGAVSIYAELRQNPKLIVFWLPCAAVAGLLIAWLIRLEPMATGSGIPQVEGVVLYGLKMRSFLVLLIRFTAGSLCAVFGLSLGREGPSIQIGSAGAELVSRLFKSEKEEKDYYITGGAAAGLSAAFNAPLSGTLFALEEVHRSFSPVILLTAATASLAADFLSKQIFGLKPVLFFSEIPQLPLDIYLWLLPLGVASGLAGVLLHRLLLLFQTLIGKIPSWSRPFLSLCLALPFGMLLPDTLGSGRNLIELSEKPEVSLTFLLLLLGAKILFTSTSFGGGVPGGIFMPILSVGALTGSAVGMLAVHLGMPGEYIACFAVCSMAGALAASVKAPITSVLLAAEMSGSLVHLLPVAVCVFSALLISDLLKTHPIYEILLERYRMKYGNNTIERERRGIREFPVEYGSAVAGKKLREINWPEGSLIVGIRRGGKELIPNGSTKILAGDYLLILFSDSFKQDFDEKLLSICHVS